MTWRWFRAEWASTSAVRQTWLRGWLLCAVVLFGCERRTPSGPLPSMSPLEAWQRPVETGLRATWLGHSTVLVEIDGRRVLTDPVWGPRTSPVTWAGPRRWYDPPLKLDELPKLDAVVISHDHYDHLDYPTIKAMKDWDTTFVVPLGVGAHLEAWGVPSARIVELDWWERTQVAGLDIVCTPWHSFPFFASRMRRERAWASTARPTSTIPTGLVLMA